MDDGTAGFAAANMIATRSVTAPPRPRRPCLPRPFGWALSLLVCGLVLHIEVPPGVQATTANEATERWDETRLSCSIWTAPTSLKGHTGGFGIYTTRNLTQLEHFLATADGPAIPIYDPYKGPASVASERFLELFRSYWWENGNSDHLAYDAGIDFQITFGALPNHHCTLDSIDYKFPNPPYNDALLSRFTDPGAGAISYGAGRDFYSRRDMAAGEEIFLNYGVCERYTRPPEDPPHWHYEVPLPVDFQRASKVALTRWDILSEAERQDSEATLAWPEDTENRFVQALLPTHMAELQALAAVRGSTLETTKLLATIPRTVDWIKANGLCLENIVPKRSTIPGAGKGAFAQFDLAQGDIVVPSPMMHILDKDALNIYNDDHEVKGRQLLMNYCLNHPDTPIFLCPNTNAVLLNHCSKRQPSPQCPDGPNAAFRWASGWNPESEKWQAMTLDEIADEEGRSLAMEVVALREIAVGDEIFVDYGPDWEAAWEAHVKNWRPSEKTTDEWITAKEANEEEAILPAFVSGDLREGTSHPYLFTACSYQLSDEDEHEDYHTPNNEWKKASDEEILDMYSDDGSRFVSSYSQHPDNSHWPCDVLKDNNEDGTYTVRIQQIPFFFHSQPWDQNGVPRLLTDYPRASIHYFPFQSDQHLPSTFRHPMGMPEDLVPQQWKTKGSFGDDQQAEL